MTKNDAGDPPAAPAAAQAVTVVQSRAPAALPVDVAHVAAWAVAIVAIIALVTTVYRLLTRDLNREIAEVKHKVGNVSGRTDALERLRTTDIERIVKLETSQASFDRSIERIERGQEKLGETIEHQFDTLAASIREIRTVGPRA